MSADKIVGRLNRLAFSRGLSSRTLGHRIGVGKSTVNRWFNFEATPSTGGLKKITRFLKRTR